MSASIMRFISHDPVSALWWDKCRSYSCDHQEDIRQHGLPFPIGSHGVLFFVCTVDNWYRVAVPVGR